MQVLNFGSLNVDHVYRVEHIARPGETIAGNAYARYAGGKGANQSVALARAGTVVRHAGRLGPEGEWLRDRMAADGVNVDLVTVGTSPGGHAIIQVDAQGQNSIVLFGGANQENSDADVARAIATCSRNDILLLQNEINVTAELIAAGHAAGLTVCLNPAPMTDAVHAFPLDRVGIFVVNEHEGEALSGKTEPDAIAAALVDRYPHARVVLTLGADGVLYRCGSRALRVKAYRVKAVDTTAAGDTFIGFFLAGLTEAMPADRAIDLGCRAAALSVTRPGAMDSIPSRADVDAFQP
jgi:ribokinase